MEKACISLCVSYSESNSIGFALSLSPSYFANCGIKAGRQRRKVLIALGRSPNNGRQTKTTTALGRRGE